jgi:hypothetical protein
MRKKDKTIRVPLACQMDYTMDSKLRTMATYGAIKHSEGEEWNL